MNGRGCAITVGFAIAFWSTVAAAILELTGHRPEILLIVAAAALGYVALTIATMGAER